MSHRLVTIVKVTPVPILEKKYFMAIELCDEPGYSSRDGEPVVWDCCAAVGFTRPEAELPRGHICNGHSKGNIVIQFNGKSVPESILDFATADSGILVGKGTSFKHIDQIYHIPSIARLRNNKTGVSGFDVHLAARPFPHPISLVYMHAIGFVGPKAVKTVKSRYIVPPGLEIRIRAVFVHTHNSAVHTRAVITAYNGSKRVLTDIDPHVFTGI